jgi:polyisoprenoid-binding protein YceI
MFMRTTARSLILAGALIAATTSAAPAKTFTVDADHTSVSFRVRHLFTKVNGRFDKFSGKIDFDPAKPEQAKVEGTIDVSSINTNVDKRDNHLRSKDFFDVEKYPTITFTSTQVTDVDAANKTGKLHGNLTMHGVTKPVVLNVAFLGEATDPWGNKKGGFNATTTINRTDFGLNWNETLETGGVLVGDEVEIEIAAEGGIAQ